MIAPMRSPEDGAPRTARPAHRWWKEPLLHFAVLGAGIYVLYAAFGHPAGKDRSPIILTDRFVEALKAEQAAHVGESSRSEGEQVLVHDYVREEALVREARRRGLDRGDPIVRRRLVQKMEFLLQGTADVPEPTDADLRAYLRAHADEYGRPTQIAFSQVFFSRDRRRDPRSDAQHALDRLRSGKTPAEHAADLGDPFLLGADSPPQSVVRLDGTYGHGFGDALAALPVGSWQGPIESGHGWHLVRVTRRIPGGTPSLDQVRVRVRAAVLHERREAALRKAEDALVASYPVVRKHDGVDP